MEKEFQIEGQTLTGVCIPHLPDLHTPVVIKITVPPVM